MKIPQKLSIILIIAFIWSGLAPKSYLTWALEVIPAIVGFILLIITYKNFKFTNLVYFTVFISIIVITIGGHYTYSDVPLFNWIKEVLGQTRNNYDKLGHFVQGFLPALMFREFFIQKKLINQRFWLNGFVITMCISISAIYEIFEWLVAYLAGGTAEEFLGTQGYIWDAQSDMLYAIVGSLSAVLFLSKLQDKAILNMQKTDSK